MTQSNTDSIPLYLTQTSDCSYLPGLKSKNLLVDPDAMLNPARYSALLAQGFRRSGRHVYRPHCPTCSACMATRLPVHLFTLKRRQRRVLKANHDVEINICTSAFDNPETRETHFSLYKKYLAARHAEGSMVDSTLDDYLAFLSTDWCETEVIECHLNNQLIAAAITDRLPDALSAVYTYFDPAMKSRSLGSLTILQQIKWAQKRGLDWLYLGYWIQNCQKMCYKTDYRPIEIYKDNRWLLLDQNTKTNKIA